MKKHLLLLILLSLLALWPFFKPGYFESHDGEWMVIRFSAFHQTFASGQFPVRFVDRLNNNYGYPVLNFLYPLPFYLAEAPKLLGLGFVDSIKTVFVVSSIASVLGMYWALSQKFNKTASLAGAIVYLFTPYRFVDLYVRGSLGESAAFTFVPLILGSIFKINKGNQYFIPILGFSVAALILSHNVIAALFLPLFIIFSYLENRKKIKLILFSYGIGIVGSSFFWIPALYDLRYVLFPQLKISNVSEHLGAFVDLINPKWGFGATPSGNGGLPIQLGVTSLIMFASTIFLVVKNKIKQRTLILFLFLFVAVSILITKPSEIIWKVIPGIDIIQFPWRLLSLTAFLGAFLTAFVVDQMKRKVIIAAIVITIALISTFTYIKPKTFVNKGDDYYSTNESSTTVRNEYLPIWVKELPDKRADAKIQVNNSSQISNQDIKFTNYQASILAREETTVQVNTIYFPGFQAKVDGKNVAINYQNKSGLITFQLPKGNHNVIINYSKTPIHLATEVVSFFSFLGMGLFTYFKWSNRNS